MSTQVQESEREMKDLREELWRNASQRKWAEVIRLYKADRRAQTAPITISGETALRMAISDQHDQVVEELVKSVEMETLRIQNKTGNTALHLAAYWGNVRMCRSIASRDVNLIGLRNNDGDTPLFLTAVHGRKEAFLCLHRLCTTEEERSDFSKGSNGKTILHAAISGEHLDLAYQIIHLYPKLINRHDKWGFLPLHVLAKKPFLFKSGYPMGILHTLTYSCIYVKKLKYVPQDDEDKTKNLFRLNLQRLRNNATWGTIRGRRVQKTDAEDPQNDGQHSKMQGSKIEGQSPELGPRKHGKRFRYLGFISKGMEAILWLGSIQIGKIIEEKKKHTYSFQIMEELLDNSRSNTEEYGGNSYPSYPRKHGIVAKETGKIDKTDENENLSGSAPITATKQSITELLEKIIETLGVTQDEKKNKKTGEKGNFKKETPFLVAAKNGVLEMVEMILEKVPAAIHDVNIYERNIALLAVENRQPHIFQFLLDRKMLKETILYKTDREGNSAMHIAAVLSHERNWDIPGPALHMQWEIKWYQFVEKSMPDKFFKRYNEKGETPWDIFRDTHKDLMMNAGKWLSKTSDSCSVVSILIATVAFAAYATVPGGINSDTGAPVLGRDTVFHVFAISSLIALCFSVSSVVMFLVFFTSRYREKDFATNLPMKFLVELSSLMVAVAALLVSFCAAHSFVIKDSLKYTAFLLYAATLLPVAFYAFWQVPMYFQLAYATFQDTPQRIYNYN